MYCSKCGNKMVEGARFCEQCGWECGAPVTAPRGPSVMEELSKHIPHFSLAMAWRAVLLIAGIMLTTLVPLYFEIYQNTAEFNKYFFSDYDSSGIAILYVGMPYFIMLAVLLVFVGMISSKAEPQYFAFAFIWFAPHCMGIIKEGLLQSSSSNINAALLYRAFVYSEASDRTDVICWIDLFLLITVLILQLVEHYFKYKAEKQDAITVRPVQAPIVPAAPSIPTSPADPSAPTIPAAQSVTPAQNAPAVSAAPAENSDQRFARRASSLADRLNTINNSQNETAKSVWECRYCGFVNDKTQDSCKSCGKYK